MNLKQLHYFIIISETGNLVEAAEKLGISQPALSKYLTALERKMGVPLFYREKKKMYLTEAGRIYLQAVSKIKRIQDETVTAMQYLRQKEKVTLKIGISPNMGSHFFARNFRIFRHYFPNIQFQLLEGYAEQLYQGLLGGAADFVITTTCEERLPGCRVYPLLEEELVLCVPAFYKISGLSSSDIGQAPTIDIRKFKDAPFVLMSESDPIGMISRRIFKDAGFTPLIICSSNNGVMLGDMVKDGAGVGLTPIHYAKESEHVVYFRLSASYRLKYSVLTRENDQLSKAERFLMWLFIQYRKGNPYAQIIQSKEVKELTEEFKQYVDLAGYEEE